VVGVTERSGRRHKWCLDWASAASARDTCRAVGGEAYEARADAVGKRLDEVGEAVADVYIVYYTCSEGVDGVAKEAKTDCDIFFGCAKGECLEEDDGYTDDAKECPYWCVP
jgi:hypothetical protein